MLIKYFILFLCYAGPALAQQAATPAERFEWLEIGPGGSWHARVLIDEANVACPSIIIDGQPVAMKKRVESSPDYQCTICELTLGKETKSAVIDGVSLKLPRGDPKKILILGDTGCRIRNSACQDCSDPNAWPWETIANQAATEDPDLIIHVGDYHYRDCINQCEDYSGPCGFNWETWRAEFFRPAKKLLPVAPWIFVRGNHEKTTLAAKGWHRFLDPLPFKQEHEQFTETYAAIVGSYRFIVMDTANVDLGPEVNRIEMMKLAPHFEKVKELTKGEHSFFLTHVPLWNVRAPVTPCSATYENSTLQAASKNEMPNLQMLLSGHYHVFAWMKFRHPDRPPQMVMGISGTMLQGTPTCTFTLDNYNVGGSLIQNGNTTFGEFGYVIMEPDPEQNRWAFTRYDPQGNIRGLCELQNQVLSCR